MKTLREINFLDNLVSLEYLGPKCAPKTWMKTVYSQRYLKLAIFIRLNAVYSI